MAGTAILATAGLAGATGVPQYFEQKKAGRRAARAQEEANQVSQASAQVANARRRRQAIAQARIAQAQNQAQQSSAVQSSSALSGIQSSISTQLGANIGAQQQQIGSQQRIQNLGQMSADALRRGQERSSMWTAAGNTFNTVTGALAGGGSFMGGGQNMPNQVNSFASQTPGPRGAGGFR